MKIVKKILAVIILILLVQTFFALFIMNIHGKSAFGWSHILTLLNYLVLILVYVYFKKARGGSDFPMYLLILLFVILFSYFIYNKVGL